MATKKVSAKVIDIKPEKVIVDETSATEPEKIIWRFVGNHLTLNAHHLAYVLNVIGVNVPPETYARMPAEVKQHFTAVKM